MKTKQFLGMVAVLSLAAFALPAQADTLDSKVKEIIKRDFRDKGIIKATAVNQDELQAMCSKYLDNVPDELRNKLEAEQMKGIPKYPSYNHITASAGTYMGDWKAGETLAQSGRGKTWTDKADDAAGGNCYNCHQLSATEIAYGTIGPSLLHYGKIRGDSVDMQRATYARIYNMKDFSACANMPRFGHMGILTDTQIKNLVALLLHKESPVNKEAAVLK